MFSLENTSRVGNKYLYDEHGLGRNLHIMAKLEISKEGDGL